MGTNQMSVVPLSIISYGAFWTGKQCTYRCLFHISTPCRWLSNNRETGQGPTHLCLLSFRIWWLNAHGPSVQGYWLTDKDSGIRCKSHWKNLDPHVHFVCYCMLIISMLYGTSNEASVELLTSRKRHKLVNSCNILSLGVYKVKGAEMYCSS